MEMIIGNPSNFALFIDIIEEWQYEDSYWVEGAFDFIFQHQFFSKKLNYYTLSEFYLKNQDGIHKVHFLEKEPPQDEKIFFMSKENAFQEMLLAYKPYMFDEEDEEDEEDEFKETTDKFILFSSSVKGFWITFVAFENQIRILAAEVHDLISIFDENGDFLRNEWVLKSNFEISEAIIDMEAFIKIKTDLNQFFEKINQRFLNIVQ